MTLAQTTHCNGCAVEKLLLAPKACFQMQGGGLHDCYEVDACGSRTNTGAGVAQLSQLSLPHDSHCNCCAVDIDCPRRSFR